jgi:ADP-dependent NAD(P)H-hydrate dehydratase / NAD(P)H-hydrate epimerase
MKLFTAEHMRQADERSVQTGISLEQLMERAGQAVAEAARRYFPEADHFLILCGKGNNGGDGYVAARFLKEAGKHVTILELSNELRGEAAQARAHFVQEGTTALLNLENLEPILKNCDAVIDALLGTGLTRALDAELDGLVKTINESGKPILSVDVPSGVGSDSGALLGEHIRATHTLQLAGAKIASAFHPAKQAFGRWEVAEIGIPKNILNELSGLELLSRDLVKPWLPQREATAHKYSVGTVLVIAGSARYLGAAELACRAAYRAGAGLVTLAAEARFSQSWPEIVFEPLSWTSGPLETLQTIPDNRAQVRVIGPGLGDEAGQFLPDLIRRSNAPTILDAGGLGSGTIWKDAVRVHERCVLTPHYGEAARLLRVTSAEVVQEPLQAALELADTFNAVIVLKGATSIIAAPDKRVCVSTRGHPGMATGGSGDVLAGCLGAFCANTTDLFERVAATVYLHGVAGEAAAKVYGNGLVASDVTEMFSKIWQGFEAKMR